MPSNALDYITIQGFKSIASIEKLKLGPINVLIGANGSGKSNFLDVFRLLDAIGEGKLRIYIDRAGGADKLLHFGSKTTAEIAIDLLFQNGIGEYGARLAPSADDGLSLIETTQGFPDPIRTIHKEIARWQAYHLQDTVPMQKTASVDDNWALRSDGSNLAALLYYLQQKHHDSYNVIRRTVQSLAPFFEDFRLEPVKLNPGTIKLEWKHKISDQHFGASSLSDGTLRFIALAALFLQPAGNRPPIIIVDEPELGLHPYAIVLLASMIRQASVDTQVIVSTQSSSLLDNFQPQDVLVAERVNGGTEISRLDAERLAKWLEDYSLGQLWEKNELGGRPLGV